MMFDSGIPLGPGLLSTWVPLPDPLTKNANARINKAAIATSIPAFLLPLRSSFGIRFSFISSDCLLLVSATGVAHFDGSGSSRSLAGLWESAAIGGYREGGRGYPFAD
jgi:hypothetical protein